MVPPGKSAGPLRAALLVLVIATAGVLAVGGAYAVVATVVPSTDPVAVPVAAPAATPTQVPAPQGVPDVAGDGELPPKTPGRPRVVVLGDTFTAGADGFAANTWPELVCQRLGCEYVPSFTTPGAGFTRAGADGHTLGGRVAEVVATEPDLVVVAGGSWDIGAPERGLRGAVNQLLYRLERRLPGTPVVVLSPFWTTAPAPDDVALARSTIDDAATKHGLAFLDVTDLFDAEHTGLISLDGSAPTSAGQAYLAGIIAPFVETALAPR